MLWELYYSRLLLSRIPRDSIKYFEISIPRHIRFAELRKKLFEQPHLTNIYVNWLLKLEIYLKYCGKEEKLLLRSNFSSFQQYFFCLLLDVHISAGTTFSLRDRRLFEISEFEIMRVNCISIQTMTIIVPLQFLCGSSVRLCVGGFILRGVCVVLICSSSLPLLLPRERAVLRDCDISCALLFIFLSINPYHLLHIMYLCLKMKRRCINFG